MHQHPALWTDPVAHLARMRPDHPVLYLSPQVLQATARRFQAGFGGLVTYAVKANARAEVLDNLVAAGIGAFDVASPSLVTSPRATRSWRWARTESPAAGTSLGDRPS